MLFSLFAAGWSAANGLLYFTSGHHWYSLAAAIWCGGWAVLALCLRVAS